MSGAIHTPSSGCPSEAARHPANEPHPTSAQRQTAELWHPPAGAIRARRATERLSHQKRLVRQERLARQKRPVLQERAGKERP
jgi:hypothetical protein